MVYLYSGFSEDFINNIYDFLILDGKKANNVALLLQGGPGYENYLDDYINPIKYHGINDINIIIPNRENNYIDNEAINIISNADCIFIGGGYTPRYIELYCTKEITKLLHNKNKNGNNIAGLSAGSIIMNELILSDKQPQKGLGLINNINIFPHFEEECYGYEMIKTILSNKGQTGYGLETNAYLEIDISGKIIKKGKGRVFKAINIDSNRVEITEVLP